MKGNENVPQVPGLMPPGMGALPGMIAPPGMQQPPGLQPPGLQPPSGMSLPFGMGVVPPFGLTPQQIMMQQVKLTAPGTSTSATTTAAKPSMWQEFESNGKKYYYNRETKKTTWDKPDELKTDAEKIVARCPWRMYLVENGKKGYFYNPLTKETTWTMPDLFRISRELLGEKNAHLLGGTEAAGKAVFKAPVESPESTSSTETTDKNATEGSTTLATTNAKESKTEKEKEVVMEVVQPVVTLKEEEDTLTKTLKEESKASAANEEDPVQVFQELLSEKVVSSERSWDEALLLIMSDKRYGVLEPMSKKRRVFEDWQMTKQLAEQRRMKEQRESVVTGFKKMMEEANARGELSCSTRWRRFALDMAKDPRFKAVESEQEQIRMFDEFVDDLVKKDKEERQRMRSIAVEQMMNELLNDKSITSSTSWKKIRDKYMNRYCSALKEHDAFEVFEQHRRSLEKKEQTEAYLARHNARQQSRERREAFRGLLKELRLKGLITTETIWRDIRPLVADDKRYKALLQSDYSGSDPRELYEDERDVARSELKSAAKRIKAALSSMEPRFVAREGMTVAEFKAALPPKTVDDEIPDALLQIILNKVISKEKHRTEKIKEHFQRLLSRKATSADVFGPSVTFADAYKHLSKHESCSLLPYETAEQMYNAFVESMSKPTTTTTTTTASATKMKAVPMKRPAASATAETKSAETSEGEQPPPAKRVHPENGRKEGEEEELEEGEIID